MNDVGASYDVRDFPLATYIIRQATKDETAAFANRVVTSVSNGTDILSTPFGVKASGFVSGLGH